MLLNKSENKFLQDLLEEEKASLEIALRDIKYAKLQPDKVRKRRIVCDIIKKLKNWV